MRPTRPTTQTMRDLRAWTSHVDASVDEFNISTEDYLGGSCKVACSWRTLALAERDCALAGAGSTRG